MSKIRLYVFVALAILLVGCIAPAPTPIIITKVVTATPVPPTSIPTRPVITSTAVPPTYYNLIARHDKTCLSVQGSSIVETTCGGSSQIWNFRPMSGGYYQVEVQNSGRCLSTSSRQVDVPFTLRSCFGNENQLWQERPSGGYFQLANKLTGEKSEEGNICVDAKMWGQPVIQWPCKPFREDTELDNQLFCQTTTNTDICTPPPDTYVINVRTDPSNPAVRQDILFWVTFSNTSGGPHDYNWWVYIYDGGRIIGETPKKFEQIRPGTTELRALTAWRIGPSGQGCKTYAAEVRWLRQSEQGEFKSIFRLPDGGKKMWQFQVC